MDVDYRVIQCNQAARQLFGNKLVGSSGPTKAGSGGETGAGYPVLFMRQSDRRESMEMLVGTRRFQVTVDPMYDRSGNYCGSLHVMRDISAETAERAQMEVLMEQERQRLLMLMDLLPDFIYVKDTQSRFIIANQAIARAYGRTPPEMVSRTDANFLPPKMAAQNLAAEQRVLAGKTLTAEEETFRFPDGQTRTVVTNMAPFRDGDGVVRGLIGIGRDITARKRSEQLLQRANRTLEAIRDCHEAMLRASTESDLLDQVCRIIVKTGGEKMVWVGFAEQNVRKTVRPVAAAGAGNGYLPNASITWSTTAHGRGPVGTAIRTRKASICRNTQTDPRFAPWRKAAREQGFGSMIALPLIADNHCFGALSIYAEDPDAFDAGEQLLLTNLANDLALRINLLRLRFERERLESEILSSIEQEQKRIGRDLHDGLCQLLVGAKLRSVYMERMARTRFPALVQEAKALEKSLGGAIDLARDLARGLNPVKVTPAGLAAALERLAVEVDRPAGPRCVCRLPARVDIPDQNVANHLYYIAQEALQNALKHARAKKISITLARRQARIVLAVEDDGAGISKSATQSGMGLGNMQTRARLIGGRLEIRRRKPHGTVILCELPVNAMQQS